MFVVLVNLSIINFVAPHKKKCFAAASQPKNCLCHHTDPTLHFIKVTGSFNIFVYQTSNNWLTVHVRKHLPCGGVIGEITSSSRVDDLFADSSTRGGEACISHTPETERMQVGQRSGGHLD